MILNHVKAAWKNIHIIIKIVATVTITIAVIAIETHLRYPRLGFITVFYNLNYARCISVSSTF